MPIDIASDLLAAGAITRGLTTAVLVAVAAMLGLFVLFLAGLTVVTLALLPATVWNLLAGPRVITRLMGRYLLKRRIAWAALLAVMLCSWMVLVQLSIMGGWLQMFRESFRTMTGDLIVSRGGMVGFDQYEQIAQRVKRLPGVEAATPVITTAGLIRIGRLETYVQVLGFQTEVIDGSPLDPVDRVMNFRESLSWRYRKPRDAGREVPPVGAFALHPEIDYANLVPDSARRFARNWPGMVVAAGVVGVRKDKDGKLIEPASLLQARAQLTVVPQDPDRPTSEIRISPQTYWVVDYSRTQTPQHDMNNVYVPIARLQRDLGMSASADGAEPARITELHIRTAPGVDANTLLDPIQQILVDVSGETVAMGFGALRVETWEQRQATLLGAIENERTLVTFLFSTISIVAVFMVFCIFYMIVVEKTRDIGIVRAVGGTQWTVAHIFIGYGVLIGIVGGALGVGLGWLTTANINWIHSLMGQLMGVQIWSPEVYAFDRIPDKVNPWEALVVGLIAVFAAAAGAVLPALRAARLNVVEALRFE